MRKSHFVSFFLTVVFGPLGVFYSSIAGGIALTIAALAIGSVTFMLGALFVWPFAIAFGAFSVFRHNRNAKLEEKRHQELVEAARTGMVRAK